MLSGLAGGALIRTINEAIHVPGSVEVSALLFFALCAILIASRAGAQLSVLYLTQKAIYELRTNLSAKILSNPYRKLQQIGKAELSVILTKDIDTFANALQIVPRVLTDGTIIIACLAYIAWISLELFLTLSTVLAACLFVFSFANHYAVKQFRSVRKRVEILYKNFRDLIDGSRELQINTYRGKAFVEQIIGQESLAFRKTFTKGFTIHTLVANVGDILFYITIGSLLFIVPHWFPNHTSQLTSATLIVLYLIGPTTSMIIAIPVISLANISLKKIQQMDDALEVEPATTDIKDVDFRAPGSCIEFREVRHTYAHQSDEESFSLGPINFQIRSGEILFIIGGNGSGKTTLAMLLSGLYSPDSGFISINGKAVTEENLASYRQNFSAIFSDFHMLEHVFWHNNDALQSEAEHYLAKFNLSHKVRIKDGKFSTLNLSTGQKKRLALIVAYLDDRQIYLFDEWAADQDPVFKKVFYTELLPNLKQRGKTIIVITHDDAYFHCANRVIKLRDGVISESVEAPTAQYTYAE